MSNENTPINMNVTLADLLTQRCVEFATGPKAVEIIDAGIEKMFKDLVGDAFRSYSDFGKSAGEAFKAALPGNIDSVLELGRYNELVLNALRAKWQESGIEQDLVQKAEAALAEVMNKDAVPERVRLSHLLDSFIEENKELAFEENWEAPDFRFEEEDKYVHFYFDKRAKEDVTSSSWRSSSERSKYQLDNNLAARRVEGADTDGHPVYEIYSAKIDGDEIRKITALGSIRSKWERALVALYYGQAKLVVDCDPDDYGYPGHDY